MQHNTVSSYPISHILNVLIIFADSFRNELDAPFVVAVDNGSVNDLMWLGKGAQHPNNTLVWPDGMGDHIMLP